MLALLLAGAAAIAVDRLGAVRSFGYSGDAAPTFRLAYPRGMAPVTPAGEQLMRLREGAGATLDRQVTVTPLALSGGGDAFARLGIAAVPYRQRAERAFGGYRHSVEGRVGLGDRGEVRGYQIVFTAEHPPGRASGRGWLRGRILLVPEPVAEPRRGIAIELIETGPSREELFAPAGLSGPLKTVIEGLEVG